MWKSVDDSSRPEIKAFSFLGRRAEYMGSLPGDRDSVLLASDGYVSEGAARAMFLSALEAAASGRSVVTVALGRGMSSVIRGTEAAGGKLHIFAPGSFSGYYSLSPDYVHASLSSGGSVAALPGKELCWKAALSFSSLFLTTVTGRSQALEEALDEGVGTCLLRPCLEWKGARRYVEEGCPVADSYSSLFSLPDALAYERADGEYGFLGSFFSIIKLK